MLKAGLTSNEVKFRWWTYEEEIVKLNIEHIAFGNNSLKCIFTVFNDIQWSDDDPGLRSVHLRLHLPHGAPVQPGGAQAAAGQCLTILTAIFTIFWEAHNSTSTLKNISKQHHKWSTHPTLLVWKELCLMFKGLFKHSVFIDS